ncbi:MAG: mechanosensitive ion channel family protein [Methanobacteriota archaeon]|nr:MAG: mechanosensitive ion channel family protein [Euryarchaeota archaeon]
MVSVMGFTLDLAVFEKVVKAAAIIIIGYILSKVSGSFTGRVVGREVNPHIGKISKKIVSYTVMAIAVVTALDLFIEVSTLLAAAGIAGIAISMAAQRSVSNIISGLFLLADQPFEIGDAVDIGGDAGEVLDISLFSTRLRTFDNKYLRIPNETVASARIINLSYYDLRRLEIPLGIAYKEDVGRALKIISGVLSENRFVLAEPEPQVMVTGFGESSIDLQIRAWVQRSELFTARTELIKEIKAALDAEGIEIPFPHRTVYFGAGEVERLKEGR